MSNVECVFNRFYKGLHVLKILEGAATCEICSTRCLYGESEVRRYRLLEISLYRQRDSKDITKYILAISR